MMSLSGHRVPHSDMAIHLLGRRALASYGDDRRRCCGTIRMRKHAFMVKHVVQPLRKESAMQRHLAPVGFGDLLQPARIVFDTSGGLSLCVERSPAPPRRVCLLMPEVQRPSPSFNLYSIVAFPAASRPTINILISGLATTMF